MPCPALTCVICHSRICEAGGHVPTSSQGNPGSGMETAWDWRLGDGRGDPLMPGPKPRVPALAPPAPLIREAWGPQHQCDLGHGWISVCPHL